MHRLASNPGHRTQERGFLLLTVMVLIFVVTLMVGWGLKRATMQSRIADLRIEDYRLHHERLGLIAIAERWMRQENPDSLAQSATSSRPAYRATLPDDTRIAILVRDGQSTLCGRVDAAIGTTREFMLDALTRIPPGASDQIRDVGPLKVSLPHASDETLLALAGGDERAFTALERLRDDPPENDQKLTLELNRADLEETPLNRLSTLVTVEPTLWRLVADVRDQHGSRRYEILIEYRANRLITHTCRSLPVPGGDSRERRGR